MGDDYDDEINKHGCSRSTSESSKIIVLLRVRGGFMVLGWMGGWVGGSTFNGA